MTYGQVARFLRLFALATASHDLLRQRVAGLNPQKILGVLDGLFQIFL